jgi:regulator of vacuolar morphogenesis
MSRKRRNTSSPEADSPPAPKRHNTDYGELDWDSSDEEESKEKPQFNEDTGQAGAFPGLGRDSDELFYGPASDGLDYLRMVR